MHAVLAMKPTLLEDLLDSLFDEVVCCAASHLLEVVLRQLRAELADVCAFNQSPIPLLGPKAKCSWVDTVASAS